MGDVTRIRVRYAEICLKYALIRVFAKIQLKYVRIRVLREKKTKSEGKKPWFPLTGDGRSALEHNLG